jgi:hypothetical protein
MRTFKPGSLNNFLPVIRNNVTKFLPWNELKSASLSTSSILLCDGLPFSAPRFWIGPPGWILVVNGLVLIAGDTILFRDSRFKLDQFILTSERVFLYIEVVNDQGERFKLVDSDLNSISLAPARVSTPARPQTPDRTPIPVHAPSPTQNDPVTVVQPKQDVESIDTDDVMELPFTETKDSFYQPSSMKATKIDVILPSVPGPEDQRDCAFCKYSSNPGTIQSCGPIIGFERRTTKKTLASVYVHLLCARYCAAFILGGPNCNATARVSQCAIVRCVICSSKGAGVGCFNPSHKKAYHFQCVRACKWAPCIKANHTLPEKAFDPVNLPDDIYFHQMQTRNTVPQDQLEYGWVVSFSPKADSLYLLWDGQRSLTEASLTTSVLASLIQADGQRLSSVYSSHEHDLNFINELCGTRIARLKADSSFTPSLVKPAESPQNVLKKHPRSDDNLVSRPKRQDVTVFPQLKATQLLTEMKVSHDPRSRPVPSSKDSPRTHSSRTLPSPKASQFSSESVRAGSVAKVTASDSTARLSSAVPASAALTPEDTTTAPAETLSHSGPSNSSSSERNKRSSVITTPPKPDQTKGHSSRRTSLSALKSSSPRNSAVEAMLASSSDFRKNILGRAKTGAVARDDILNKIHTYAIEALKFTITQHSGHSKIASIFEESSDHK